MYDPLQQFLSDKWGPLGGWCQAVVFAAEIARRAGVGVEATQTMTVKAEKEVKVAVENVVTTTETTRTKRHKLLEAPASPPTRPKRLRPAK
jgi:N-glycosylase/DNA lyase